MAPPRPTGCRAFPRFWERDSFENLFAYTRSFFDVNKDAASGVTKLDVAAFDAPSAKAIADAMLALAGDMANSLNARAQADMVDSSKRELDEARDDVVKVADRAHRVPRSRRCSSIRSPSPARCCRTSARCRSNAPAPRRRSPKPSGFRPTAPALESLKASASALDQQGRRGARQARRRQFGARRQGRQLRAPDAAARSRAEALRRRAGLAANGRDRGAAQAHLYRGDRPAEPARRTDPARAAAQRRSRSFVVGFIAFSILWILSVGSKDHAQ